MVSSAHSSVTASSTSAGGGDGASGRSSSPRAEVPALVDGSFSLYDSTVICEYLEDRSPEPPISPRDPQLRAECRLIEDLADTQLDAATYAVVIVERGRREPHPAMHEAAGRDLQRLYDELERGPVVTSGPRARQGRASARPLRITPRKPPGILRRRARQQVAVQRRHVPPGNAAAVRLELALRAPWRPSRTESVGLAEGRTCGKETSRDCRRLC
jgi:Glutathione S-transferase, N-terminal domain